MKKNATLLIILLIISIIILSGCNEKSPEVTIKSKFVGSWQPDKMVKFNSEIWTFYSNNTVKIVATNSEIDNEENNTLNYNWTEINGELIVIPPESPSNQIYGRYEFNNDYTSFLWLIKGYEKEILHYYNVTFTRIQ